MSSTDADETICPRQCCSKGTYRAHAASYYPIDDNGRTDRQTDGSQHCLICAKQAGHKKAFVKAWHSAPGPCEPCFSMSLHMLHKLEKLYTGSTWRWGRIFWHTLYGRTAWLKTVGPINDSCTRTHLSVSSFATTERVSEAGSPNLADIYSTLCCCGFVWLAYTTNLTSGVTVEMWD